MMALDYQLLGCPLDPEYQWRVEGIVGGQYSNVCPGADWQLVAWRKIQMLTMLAFQNLPNFMVNNSTTRIAEIAK